MKVKINKSDGLDIQMEIIIIVEVVGDVFHEQIKKYQ